MTLSDDIKTMHETLIASSDYEGPFILFIPQTAWLRMTEAERIKMQQLAKGWGAEIRVQSAFFGS